QGEGIVQTTNALSRDGEAAKAVAGTKIPRRVIAVPVRVRLPAPFTGAASSFRSRRRAEDRTMQNPPRVWLDYRPVRIGWIIPEKDIQHLVTAANWSTCHWGGRFHPLIPISDVAYAERLVKCFAVDVLVPVQATAATQSFVDRFPYLAHERWRSLP